MQFKSGLDAFKPDRSRYISFYCVDICFLAAAAAAACFIPFVSFCTVHKTYIAHP